MTSEEIAAKISQRRRQILVHSIIYYRLDDSIIPDYKWGDWAKELAELQEQYPEIAAQCPLADEFKDFFRFSGYYLPLGDPHYSAAARWLIDYHRRMGGEIHET